jgi:hypothetical protein
VATESAAASELVRHAVTIGASRSAIDWPAAEDSGDRSSERYVTLAQLLDRRTVAECVEMLTIIEN